MKNKTLGVILMAIASFVNAEESYEIVSFSYKEEIPFSLQKIATESLNDIVSRFPGFKSREYYYSEENNRWFDFVTWESITAAKAASEKVMNDPEAMKLFTLMDKESMIFSHYKALGGVRKD